MKFDPIEMRRRLILLKLGKLQWPWDGKNPKPRRPR